MATFGKIPKGDHYITKQAIRRDCMILAGFAIYVAFYLRRAKQRYNNAAHTELVVGAVRSYYEHMH